MQIAQLRGNLTISNHAAAAQDYAAAAALGNIDDLLNSWNTRGKCRDQHFACTVLYDLLEIGADLALRRRVSRPFDVGRIGEQQQHTLLAVGGECLEIEHLAFHRGVVDFKIASMNHRAHWTQPSFPSSAITATPNRTKSSKALRIFRR